MAEIIDSAVFDTRVAELDALAKGIVLDKRPSYVNGSKDTIRNFRVRSAVQRCTVGDAIMSDLIKQITAIQDIMNNPDSSDIEKATRFADARNYIDIAYVTYKEGHAHVKYLP